MTELVPPSPLSLVYGIATCEQPRWRECVASWNASALSFHPSIVVRHRLILDAYQEIYDQAVAQRADLIAYLHDDLRIDETDWDERVLAEFADPAVAIVGFAGAPGYGSAAMYSQPYSHSSLGRVGFQSNLANAELHGSRFRGERDVACLDGLALICRRAFLDELGGWEWRRSTPEFAPDYNYYLYAEALCCHALRLNRRIRLVGIACEHLDHRSTGLNPRLNATLDFEGEHRRLFDEFRGVLPTRVEDCNE